MPPQLLYSLIFTNGAGQHVGQGFCDVAGKYSWKSSFEAVGADMDNFAADDIRQALVEGTKAFFSIGDFGLGLAMRLLLFGC